MALLLLALGASFAAAQMTLDTTNNPAVMAALGASMPALKMFYQDNNANDGAWLESYTTKRNLVQWHESGIYWGLFYEYNALTGDGQYSEWVDSQMQVAIGPNNGFLDAQSAMTGRWNDDIGWWALAVMFAAESTQSVTGIVAPTNRVDGTNPTYLSVVNNTYYAMWGDWDASTCGGGMYWSRNRQATTGNDATYKSSITNAQHIDLSARLYTYTGDETYHKLFDTVYTWMQTSNLIDPVTYAVHDGIDANGCVVTSDMYSYHSGELIAGLSIMYKKTQDAKYLTEAHKHFQRVATNFTINNVLFDWTISPTGPSKPNGFLWPVYKSLGYLYSVTTDSSVKQQIAAIMAASAAFQFQSCNSDWYCIRNLDPNTDHTLFNGTSVRDQFEIVSVLNALAVTTGTPVIQITQAVAAPNSGNGGGGGGSGSGTTAPTGLIKGISNTVLFAAIGGGVVVLLVVVVGGVFVARRRKQRMGREGVRKGVSNDIYYNARERRNGEGGDGRGGMGSRQGGGARGGGGGVRGAEIPMRGTNERGRGREEGGRVKGGGSGAARGPSEARVGGERERERRGQGSVGRQRGNGGGGRGGGGGGGGARREQPRERY
ncbi:hydrolase 76 protein [Podochytrium sp. JEL0797]|nr:hydrolase 76 protein [Podochytrium sp. JEL0797]